MCFPKLLLEIEELDKSIPKFNLLESNNLENAVIQISDGKLKFQNVKQTAPLTFKLVKEVLDECIDNEQHVKAIIKAIKDKRESKYVYDIKRTYS